MVFLKHELSLTLLCGLIMQSHLFFQVRKIPTYIKIHKLEWHSVECKPTHIHIHLTMLKKERKKS